MSDTIHLDEFGDSDDESHLMPKAAVQAPFVVTTKPGGFLPDLEHVGPLQSGSLRPFVGVDLGTRSSHTVFTFADRRTVDISDIMASLADEYQRDQPMLMAQIGALTNWVSMQSLTFEDACALGQAAGLDLEHARRLAYLAGFKPVTRVRFEVDSDEDASRIAGVLGALGFTPVRVVATGEHRNRWALAELLRTKTLSPSVYDLAASKLGVGGVEARPNAYLEQRLMVKLGGKTIEQAVAEIAEVRS